MNRPKGIPLLRCSACSVYPAWPLIVKQKDAKMYPSGAYEVRLLGGMVRGKCRHCHHPFAVSLSELKELSAARPAPVRKVKTPARPEGAKGALHSRGRQQG